MKKAIIKTILTVLLSMFIMTSCGSATDKIRGEWTIKSINGKSPADFAADNNVYELGTAKNFLFTDKDVTVTAVDETGSINKQTYKIVSTDNGLEIDASGYTVSFEFAEADEQLRYSVKQNDIQYQYILKRGSTDLKSLMSIKTERGKAPAADASSTEQDDPAA